jgi:hypothetical protein
MTKADKEQAKEFEKDEKILSTDYSEHIFNVYSKVKRIWRR